MAGGSKPGFSSIMSIVVPLCIVLGEVETSFSVALMGGGGCPCPVGGGGFEIGLHSFRATFFFLHTSCVCPSI